MRYLSSDNGNDQKRDEVGTKASPAGKLLNTWSPEQIAQWQLAALTP